MRKILIFVLLLGFMLRVVLLLVSLSAGIPKLESLASGGDAIGYTQLAVNMADHHVFAFAEGKPTAYRMPGYPLFLALSYMITGDWLFIRIVQILSDMVAIYLVYQMASKATNSFIPAVFAALFMALNPLIIISTVSLLPETLTCCLMILTAFFLIHYPEAKWVEWLVPVILGTVLYLKPTLFPVALILCMEYAAYRYFESNAAKAAILSMGKSLLIFSVMLTPWIVRNYMVLDSFIPLTTSTGSNLYGGNNPAADGGYVSSEPYVASGMSEIESDNLYRQRAISWIRSNWTGFISLIPSKVFRFFWPLSLGTSGTIAVPPSISLFILLLLICFYALVVSGLVICVSKGSYWQAIVLTTPLVILVFLSVISFGAARFSLPSFPSLAVLAALPLDYLVSRIPRFAKLGMAA